MKYNITINQKAIIDLDLNLDVVDMSIFDFIKDFSLSSSCLKVIIDGRQYFWISHSKIISDLPIIRISTRQGIVKRVNKLIEAGLISRYDVDAQKSYYCFGNNYDKVTFVTERKQSFTLPDNESLQQPVNSCLHNNNIINNNTIDNKIDFDKLISYFNKVFNKSARVINKQDRSSFNKRLSEGYTKEDIAKVMDNCSFDINHKDNDYLYVTFEFLSRPKIFQRYASMKHQRPIKKDNDAFYNQ